MKFISSIIINKPLDQVVEAFLDPESLKKSQKGFIKKEIIKGQPNEVGTVSKLIYEKFEMIETITANDLPNSFSGFYEHKLMTNTMRSTFEAISSNQTKFSTEIEYKQFKGLLIKIIAKLYPGMFIKQVKEWLQQFKSYVENL